MVALLAAYVDVIDFRIFGEADHALVVSPLEPTLKYKHVVVIVAALRRSTDTNGSVGWAVAYGDSGRLEVIRQL